MLSKGLYFIIIIYPIITYSMDHQRDPTRKIIDIRLTLLDATKYRHLSEVKKRIQEGQDINQRDNQDFTPLHWAALSGDNNLVTYLLNHGAYINAQSQFPFTQDVMPLHLAVSAARVEVVKTLLQKDAWVNTMGKSWNFRAKPLDLAIHRRNIIITYYLLRFGAQTDRGIYVQYGDYVLAFIKKMVCIAGVLGIPSLLHTIYILQRDMKLKRGNIIQKQETVKNLICYLKEKRAAFDRIILIKALESGYYSFINACPELQGYFVEKIAQKIKP